MRCHSERVLRLIMFRDREQKGGYRRLGMGLQPSGGGAPVLRVIEVRRRPVVMVEQRCECPRFLSAVPLPLLRHLRRAPLCATPWLVARHAPLSVEFSGQESWSGLPCPPWELPNPGVKPGSSTLQADSLPLSHQGKPKLYP